MADLFRALSHPVRIMIVERLMENKRCVNAIKNNLHIKQPNISQHLLILRMNGIVNYEQSGKTKCYFLLHPELVKNIFRVMKEAGSFREKSFSRKPPHKAKYPEGKL